MTLPTPNDSDRGQVGIGTLIIFIALVLVAAVAAGVLIDTSGQLESRASDTGADAQAEVSNQIEVVSATGATGGSNPTTVDEVTLIVKKSPGSDPIDLQAATIQYTSDGASETISHESEGSGTTFTTSKKAGSPSEDVLANSDQRIQVTIDISDIEGDGSAGTGLEEGESAELEIVDQSGASTVFGVNVPNVLTGSYVDV